MTNRAWRVQNRLHIECDHCSSRGHTHSETSVSVDPETAKKLAEYRAKIDIATMEYRAVHEAGLSVLKALPAGTSLADCNKANEEVAAKLKNAHALLMMKVNAAKDMAPKLREGITEILEKCPWCWAALNVPVEILPDGQSEPMPA